MTDRDRLIELLENSPQLDAMYGEYDVAADWLLANGVTLQEWISTKDRLPEDISPVLFYTPVPSFEIGYYDGVEWLRGDVWYERDEVTHWMPLPKPPKGVRS